MLDEDSGTTGLSRRQIIDGQQRVVTGVLVMLALGAEGDDAADSDLSRELIADRHLLSAGQVGDDRFKILLTPGDRDALMQLINGNDQALDPNSRVVQNYEFFKLKIRNSRYSVNELYQALARLTVVEIVLSTGEDNPQLIFESLNSTGEALTQSDLIRNFLLMGLGPAQQTSIYESYWRPMEEDFTRNGLENEFDNFMRAYLSLELERQVNLDEIYEDFKKVFDDRDAAAVEDQVARLVQHASYYVKLVTRESPDADLSAALERFSAIKVQKAPRPLLLRLWHEYAEQRLRATDFARIVDAIETFLVRRAVCGLRGNALDLLFIDIASRILPTDHYYLVAGSLRAGRRSARFPTDEEFETALAERDMYNFTQRDLILHRLADSYHDRERVDLSPLSVEHILPQNTDLNKQWQSDLGSEWQSVQERQLHRLGNLTLTGYNSTYSDRPFAEKKSMEKGLASSPLLMNREIAEVETWNEEAIITRGAKLAVRARMLWALPAVPADVIQRARDQSAISDDAQRGEEMSTATIPEWITPEIAYLFAQLEQGLRNLGEDVEVRPYKTRVSFVAFKIFAMVVDAPAGEMRIRVDADLDSVDDPLEICTETPGEGIGSNGGRVQIRVRTVDELHEALRIAADAYTANSLFALGREGD